jgi:cytoskeleton protein RodZ
MNAESTAATDDIEQVATTTGTPGELLRAQREQRQLSVQQAAEDLHLDVRLVEALESNDFEALGPPVYAKGHLRKYAALLGLSPDLVMARYQMLAGAPPEIIPIPMTASAPPRRRRRGLASVPKPIVVVAVLLLVVAAVWWGVQALLPARHVQMPVTVVPAVREPEVAGAPEATTSTTGADATRSPPAVASAASAAPGSQPEPAAAQANVTMRLEFTAPSWSEIYDASGKRLMFDVGQPGQVRTLSGVAPLKVTLGVAAAANVMVNNRSIAVPRQPGKDATRFLVAADGSVR